MGGKEWHQNQEGSPCAKRLRVRTGAWDQGEEGLKDQTRGGLLENWELEALKCGPGINT